MGTYVVGDIHGCYSSWIKLKPVDMFIKTNDDLMVDDSMEKWLRDIETKLTYEKWYAGHFHCDRKIDKLCIEM